MRYEDDLVFILREDEEALEIVQDAKDVFPDLNNILSDTVLTVFKPKIKAASLAAILLFGFGLAVEISAIVKMVCFILMVMLNLLLLLVYLIQLKQIKYHNWLDVLSEEDTDILNSKLYEASKYDSEIKKLCILDTQYGTVIVERIPEFDEMILKHINS